MKVESLDKFKEIAQEMFRNNPHTRYFMKYRDNPPTIFLKATDDTTTITYEVTDRKELHAVTEVNMKMLSIMSGRTKLE
ncbi:Signal recognition particle 9 kDa protein [Entamoeba marina]